MTDKVCPICSCDKFKKEGGHSKYDKYHVDCRRCGKYWVDGLFLIAKGSGLTEAQRCLLSCVIREHNEQGNETVDVSDQTYEQLLAGREISRFSDKKIKFLQIIRSKTPELGEKINFDLQYDYPLFFLSSSQEFLHLSKELVEEKLITCFLTPAGLPTSLSLISKGYEYLENNTEKVNAGNKVFIAMWFNPDLTDAYRKGIKPAVEACRFHAVRIDDIQHNNKICDEILKEIKECKFMVADVTGHRPSVYFEAGYAKGLNKEIIWLCQDDHREDLHFDTRQYNHIFWSTPEELRTRLEQRIAQVFCTPQG